jgi:hypothetical protein
LISSIEVVRRDTKGDNRSYVVGFSSKIHEGSGLPSSTLASILELGLGGIPARPVIQPTWYENASEIRAVAREVFKRHWKRFKGV